MNFETRRRMLMASEKVERLYIYKQGNSGFENCTYSTYKSFLGDSMKIEFNYSGYKSAALMKGSGTKGRVYFYIDVTKYKNIIIEGYHSTKGKDSDFFGFSENVDISTALKETQITTDKTNPMGIYEFDVSDKTGGIIFAYERNSEGTFFIVNMYLE